MLGNVYVMGQDVQVDRTESFARCGCNEIGLRQAASRWRDARWCCRCGTTTSMRHAGSRCLVLRVIHLARPAEGALLDVLLALMRGSYAYISVFFQYASVSFSIAHISIACRSPCSTLYVCRGKCWQQIATCSSPGIRPLHKGPLP
jgi:hypothetical protein